ncbi:unnamed protein product, partial [Laminaria digitata]
MEWKLPWGTSKAVRGHENYLARLTEIHEEMNDPEEPLLSWGYHRIWHGELSRAILDAIAPDRPVLVWQRSFHEMYLNSAGIRWLELDEEEVDRHHQVDIANGRFFEMGKLMLLEKLNPYLLDPTRFMQGLERLKQVVRLGGHTTVGDMGIGIFDLDMEWSSIRAVLDTEDTPFRIAMIPRVALATDVEKEMDRLVDMRSLAT